MSDAGELGFPIKGSLKRTPFPSLVKQIADARAEGSLYLLSGKTKKVVFFEDGQPVFVRSNVLSECLGQILAREGLITQEQCEQTLEAIRRTGKKQGELLVEMGILSEGNLRYGLEAQLRHKLFDIFAWEEGRYQFKAGANGQASGMRVSGGAEGIIVAAILDTHEEPRARALLEPEQGRFPRRKAGESTDGLELTAREEHFLAGLDGSRSVIEILADPAPTAPTPATLLYALAAGGYVSLERSRQAVRPAPPPPDEGVRDQPDEHFVPAFEPSNLIKSYEDTPLPGALPRADDGLPEDDEDMFGGLERPLESTGHEREVSEDLLAAESEDVVDETFDEGDIELLDAEELEIVDEDEDETEDPLTAALGAVDDDLEAVAANEADPLADPLAGLAGELEPDDDLVMDDGPAQSRDAASDDELMGLDELDDLDIGLDAGELAAPEPAPAREEVSEEDAEVMGAMSFSEGEMALQSGEFERAVELLESAYENGIDVAELHAMLAYGRFKTAEDDAEMQTHALDLIEYAAELNPNLDIVFAYRGEILRARGDLDGAREALQQALEINPYCDLALELMDEVG